MQWLLFPDSMKDEEAARQAQQRAAEGETAAPQLPKVRVTAKPEQVRQAFTAAERLGKLEVTQAVQQGGEQGRQER